MSEKLKEILKYFFLTFISFELIHYIAKGQFNFSLVLIVSLCFTILFSIEIYGLWNKTTARDRNKSKPM